MSQRPMCPVQSKGPCSQQTLLSQQAVPQATWKTSRLGQMGYSAFLGSQDR